MDTGNLSKNWVHSYEEDTENEIVFRPPTYNFPLLRGGRDALDLRGDKTYTQRGDLIQRSGNLTADDRYNYAEGNWNLEGNSVLTLHGPSGTDPAKLKIVSISNDKLVFQK